MSKQNWRNQRRKRQPRCRGQSLVEFALVILPLVLLLVGVVSMSFTMYTAIVVNQAAQRGVDVAAQIAGDGEMVQQTISSSLHTFFVFGDFGYTVTPAQANFNEEITVAVTYLPPLRVLFWEFQLPEVAATRTCELDRSWINP